MWYAHQPSRRARQIIGDGAALLWVAGWAVVAVGAHRVLGVATRPRIGLPGPLHGVARAGDRIVSAAPEGAGPVRLLVLLAALAVFVVPVGLLCALWLPRRIRWVRRAAAARDLANSEDGRELLALRALLRPLDEVGRTAEALPETTPGSLAEGWREGDPATLDALAEAELIRLGLRTA